MTETLDGLRDHVDLATGFAFKSRDFTTSPPGIRLVRGDNIGEGRLRWDDRARYWPRPTPDLQRYLLAPNDVLIGMDGSRVGKNRARVQDQDLPLLLVQRIARLRARESIDPLFLFYLVSSSSFQTYVDRVKTGTSIPHISREQILAYQFWRPPLKEQRFLGSLLGGLDDKIELNRRMNGTLTAIVGEFFEHVIGDDERQSRDSNSMRLSDLVSVTRDSLDPQAFPDEFFLHYSIPAFDAERQPVREPGSEIKSTKLTSGPTPYSYRN